MKVKAWNNGKHLESGAGYGLKLSIDERDEFFDKKWSSVFLLLPNNDVPIEIDIAKKSFWNDTFRELISKDIGIWLHSIGDAPWIKGNPPEYELLPTGDNTFRIGV